MAPLLVSTIARAVASGNIARAAGTLLMAPINPVVRPIRGAMIKHLLELPDAELTPEMQAYKRDFIQASCAGR